MVAVVASALVVFGAASAAAQPVPRQPASTTTSSGWGDGVEAVLPADAAPTGQSAGVRVVCPSAGNCSAIGTYLDSSGNRQMVLLTETAGVWSPGIQAVLPANAATTQDDGVFEIDAMSCPSAGNCSAVGTYTDDGGNWQGLLLTQAAGTWAPAVEATLPSNALSRQMVALLGMSCASAGNCTAVGSYFDAAQKLQVVLLTETAGNWAPGVEATLPPDATAVAPPAFYGSVSCTSPGNCTVVGTYQGGAGTEGVVLTQTGGSWGPGVKAPLPSDAAPAWANAGLGSVSCPSAGSCSAVGHYTDGSDNVKALLLTETAGTWSGGIEPVLPANAATSQQSAAVSAPSCPSTGNCGAAGSYTDSSGNKEGMLLTETAGTWSPAIAVDLPANAATTGQKVFIDAPSCSSPGNCSAVGTYVDSSGNTEGLLLTESAGTWSPAIEAVLPANAAATKQQTAVGPLSCSSAGDCGAVGSYVDDSGNTVGVLLTETSGTWGDGETPSLPANASSPASYSFGSVACPSAGDCSAGGYYAAGSSAGSAALLLGGSAPAVKLDVATAGEGSGTVSSEPAGIDCGSTCSGSFGAGTSLTLTATASPRSRFSGWSGGGCTGTGSCQVNTGISEQTVTATFTLLPKQCVVPRLKGKTLKAARHAIRTRSCTVGKVRHQASRKIRKGRVISQRPKAGSRLKHAARINLVVSKGRRR